MRYDKNTDYITMWTQDKNNMITIMYHNMVDDLYAGYDPLGSTITRELEMISTYKAEYQNQITITSRMDTATRNRWCYDDMIRRGAIS